MALRMLSMVMLLGVVGVRSLHASTGCPGGVLFDPDPTGSSVDAGSTGIAHDMPAVGYSFRMNLSCGPSSPPCGACSITGLSPNAGGNNQRCTNNTSIICTTATEVADCGGPGLCHFFAAPPTGVAAGGVTTCYTSEIVGPVTGTANVDTGALAPNVPFQATLYGGIAIDNPCPRCVGDGSVNDNVRGGTCDAGMRATLACDANAVNEYPDFGATSFDCPPNPASSIAQFILGTVTFSTAAQSIVLSATSPSCSGSFPFGSKKCLCDTCNNGSVQVCDDDSDCPDPPGPIPAICGGRRCISGTNVGAACTLASECPGGFCARPGEPTRPNSCLDDTAVGPPSCVDTSPVDGEGECVFGPTTANCSLASGHPQRSCLDDTDCGGMLGSCVVGNFKCYLDNGVLGGSVSVSGTATPPVGNTSDPTALGMLACLNPTGSSSVNNVGGFPGLARGLYAGRAIFAEEIVVEVVSPGGTATTSGSGPASVVETSVTTPVGGEVEIVGTFNAGSPPSGYEFLGRLVQITALPASAASPLRIGFDIVASEVPPGENESTIQIFRNGVGPIPDCLGATQAIPDDPCVTERAALGGGDVRIAVLTSAASEWTMAVPDSDFCPPTITGSCNTPIVPSKSALKWKDQPTDTKDQLQWKWAAGHVGTTGDFGLPTTTDSYGLCFYDGGGNRLAGMLIPAGGSCAEKPCWKAKPTGFQYKDKELTPHGISQLNLKAGLNGKAQIQVKGKGENLAMLSTVPSTLTVQLRNVMSGQCWTTTHIAPFDKFEGVDFKDKGD